MYFFFLGKKSNGAAMRTGPTVGSNSRSPTPSSMEGKHSRFAMLGRIFKPWKWKRKKKSDKFEQTSKSKCLFYLSLIFSEFKNWSKLYFPNSKCCIFWKVLQPIKITLCQIKGNFDKRSKKCLEWPCKRIHEIIYGHKLWVLYDMYWFVEE